MVWVSNAMLWDIKNKWKVNKIKENFIYKGTAKIEGRINFVTINKFGIKLNRTCEWK